MYLCICINVDMLFIYYLYSIDFLYIELKFRYYINYKMSDINIGILK